jgi:methionine biosynthesis protein MetW
MPPSPATPAPSLRERRAGAYENERPEVQALVPTTAQRVLDLGCSSGRLGAALKARQRCEVVGIELDPRQAADAQGRLDRVLTGDLEVLAGEPPEDLGHFDCLIAADVLEHLRDPWSVLASFAGRLAPGGTCVISLPNVRFWEVFWVLGRYGTWPQRDEGIFDRTHLRWFTLHDACLLLEQAGLEVRAVRPIHRLRPRQWWARPLVLRGLAASPLEPIVTFQYVIAAVRPSSGAPGP